MSLFRLPDVPSRGAPTRKVFGGAVAAVLLALSGQGLAQAPTKIAVDTRADLPQFTYPVSGTAKALVTADDATFNAFARKVGADVDQVLASYDVRDKSTLRELLGVRADVQALLGEYDAAIATTRQIRELEDKPDRKLLTRTFNEASLKARKALPAASPEALSAAFAEIYAETLKPMPWDVVGSVVLARRTDHVFMTEAISLGTIDAYIEPGVAKSGQVSSATAAVLISERLTLKHLLPLKAAAMQVLGDYIAANKTETPDLWTARNVDLAGRANLAPVNVAIWDEGTDLSLFPGQVFTDPDPDPRYDRHGLAFDLDFNPSHGALIPLTDAQRAAYPARVRLLKGATDMNQGLDTPESDFFVRTVEGLSAEEVPPLQEEMVFLGSFYTHGTHVAGIAAEGNPAIRLAYGRQNWDWRNTPAPPTDEGTARLNRNTKAFVDWFRTRRMRVVNMSWAGEPAYLEQALEANGIGQDAAERKTMARRFFDRYRQVLYDAIKSAPDILFVAAAGNSNSDAGFDEAIPASFDLPNLLVAGAVDKSGNETAFTSYGKTVSVHANGQEVEAYIPGGQKLRLSGTSMAAPQVVNLAAKLLALDPGLTPAELIALIESGATRTADGRRNNIHPKRSVELLMARKDNPRDK